MNSEFVKVGRTILALTCTSGVDSGPRRLEALRPRLAHLVEVVRRYRTFLKIPLKGARGEGRRL